MTGPVLLRDVTNRLLEAVRLDVEREAQGGVVSLTALGKVFDHFMASPDYLPFFAAAYQELAPSQTQDQRHNAFGRGMVQPLMGLLDGGQLDRSCLPNLFSFFRLALGDEQDRFDTECQTLLDRIKAEAQGRFAWEMLYQDERCRTIYWQVLMRVAVLFKRWDLRKDWFLKLMQYTPTATSLGSKAFQVNAPHAAAATVFDEAAFKALFKALFAPFARLTPLELADFRQTYGEGALTNINAVLGRL